MTEGPEPANELSPSLTARVARGAGFIVASRFVMGFLGFLNTVIVARLLLPDDFGIVAIGLGAMQILTNVSDIGVAQAVIKFHDAARKDLDTLFTLSVLRGAIIAILLVATAPFAADFYGEPRVFWVFTGCALYPLFTAFINPKFFEFERDLDYSKEFFATIIFKLAGVIVSIAVAVVFQSYWAMILGLAANGFVQMVLSYTMRPYRPHLTLASLHKVFAFSGWLTGVGLMSALNNKLDPLVIARVIGASGAGHYFMGMQLAELPTREVAYPAARAIYPGLSELQGDPARMRDAYLKGVEAIAAIAMPAAIGFALIARDLIPLLLGDKWADAIPVVEIITPVLGAQMPFLATQFYAMALGATRLVFFRELAFFFVRTPLFIAATLAFGLEGAAAAIAGCGALYIALNLVLYARVAGDRLWRPMWRVRRSFLASVAMAAIVMSIRSISLLEPADPLIRILAEIVAGAASYIGVHALLWRIEGLPNGAERAMLDFGRPLIRRALNR
ncbi:MAG: oligosaccharide flippase family protein [Parvularculaceae bacterium]|nr:oligosaccharide flippase family protein [Parvularculaceae bacterium]